MADIEYEEHLEDIIEIQNTAIPLSDINLIAQETKIQKQFEKDFNNRLYSSILMSLTHKAFEENEAKKIWNNIKTHMKNLEETLGRHVGISVATLDYLSNIKDLLLLPIIIEEKKSDFVAETSTVDELTRLYLRDVFNVVLTKKLNKSNRTETYLSLLMIDIDDFKKVNDKYGHQTGDEVLRKIGQCINGMVRDMDLAARYGGEELVIILPDLNIEQTFKVGERIRKAIQSLQFDGFSVTVSIGLCGTDGKKSIISEDFIKNADLALYKAKDAGKNRTVIWDPRKPE